MKMADMSTSPEHPGRSVAGTARPTARPLVLRYVRTLTEISADEAEFLLQSTMDAASAPAGTELVCAGAVLNQPRMILSGWIGLAVFLPDGRRQLLDFALPGDIIGLNSRPDARAKASHVCLTAVETARTTAFLTALEQPLRYPGLARACRSADDQFEGRLFNQIVRIGCQNALEKLSSLLAEFFARLARVGLVERDSFMLPISQVVIGDALGLSTVHVNRTFQQLRRERIVQWEGHRVTVLDIAALRKLAGQLNLPGTGSDTAV